MTDIDLDAIRAREQAAPKGPWRWAVSDDRRWVDVTAPNYERVIATTHDDDLAAFIAHARTDVPALIAAVQCRDDALAAVLAWAADDEHHMGACRKYRPYRTADGPPSCDCCLRDLLAAITAHLTPDVPMSPNKGHADNPTTDEDR